MTQHLDLDALQAAAEAAIEHGDAIGEPDWHEPGYAITMEATCPDAALICACSPHMILSLIDRLRKAEAQHADLLKSMFEIAWSNDSQWQADAAKQACLRNPALSYPAAPGSTPTDSADSATERKS